jgi:hypothetical protein
MPLRVRDLATLPDDAIRVCELADGFLRDWVPSVATAETRALPLVYETEARLQRPLPSSLRWA